MSRTKRTFLTIVSVAVIAVAGRIQGTSAQGVTCHACANSCDALLAESACDVYCPDEFFATHCFSDEYEFCDTYEVIIECQEPTQS